MKKGFTLIELLAVIIVLAIVALIATAIVLNVIDDAKDSAARSEANLVYSAAKNYCAAEEMQYDLDNTITKICDDTDITPSVLERFVNTQAEVTGHLADEKVTELSVTYNGITYILVDGVMVRGDAPDPGSLPVTNQISYTNSNNPDVNNVEDAIEDLYNQLGD